ncbi:MAG: hypothetical protein KC912_16560 [Proteobacteria bacterium]|nr:hypothetical protein [Pseudomonadota bacterium]
MRSLLTLLLAAFLVPADASEPGVIEGVIQLKRRPSDGPVVVYIDGEGPSFSHARSGSVVQRNRAFEPGSLIVSRDAVIDFPNQDNVLHNVFSLTPGSEFDLAEYGAGQTRSWVAREAGEVEVYCNRHEDMAMKVLVLPNAWHSEVDEQGHFRIQGVSPGEHTLVAWSPDHWEQRIEVVVPDSGAVDAQFTLKRRPADVPHTNKFGMPYYR